MSNGTIPQPRESWWITNISGMPLPMDIPALNPIAAGASFDTLTINGVTAELLAASDTFRNHILNRHVRSPGYLHTHDDRAYEDHTHTGLDILTAGPTSNADDYHTHSLSTPFPAAMMLEDDLLEYVRKDGSITQLSDITSIGAVIESAVTQAHDQDHTLLEHTDSDYPFTVDNFRKLFDGSNADCLHIHSYSVSGEHNDLDGLNEGDYLHLTAAEYVNFGTLTDGSNADALHVHSGISGVSDHAELDGLQGGTYTDPSLPPEYYHLDYSQYLTLIGGPSSNADDLHTHSFAGSLTVQDESVDICSSVTTINFLGATVQAKDCIDGLVNVYIPPLTYVSHFNANDGTNNCTVSDKSTTTRYISSPLSEQDPSAAYPFEIGDWSAGTTHSAIKVSESSCSYTSNNECSFDDDSSTTIEVNIYGANGVTKLATHTTAAITGNINVTVDNIQIRVTSWAADSDKYKGVITVDFDIDTVLNANGYTSGRFSVEIIHHDGGDGPQTYTQDDIFYDNETNSQVMGSVEISVSSPVVIQKSGVYEYDTGTEFLVTIDDLDYMNSDTYQQPFVKITGDTYYGLSDITLNGGDLTDWSNSFDSINDSYSKSDWTINSSNFFQRTDSATISAGTRDWGVPYTEDTDDSEPEVIIIDTYNDSSTRVYEDFRGESERMKSDLGTSWDGTQDLSTYDSGSGLQVGEGTYLFFPGHSGLTGFPTADGDYTDYSPNASAQPDYSSLAGNPSERRYYYRGMWHTGENHSNGLFNITGATEQNITDYDLQIEISLNGTDWFNCNETYLGGALSDGDPCRIYYSEHNLDLNDELRFTLGPTGVTNTGTGPGWGMWIRISMSGDSTVQMNKIEITDWED